MKDETTEAAGVVWQALEMAENLRANRCFGYLMGRLSALEETQESGARKLASNEVRLFGKEFAFGLMDGGCVLIRELPSGRFKPLQHWTNELQDMAKRWAARQAQ